MKIIEITELIKELRTWRGLILSEELGGMPRPNVKSWYSQYKEQVEACITEALTLLQSLLVSERKELPLTFEEEETCGGNSDCQQNHNTVKDIQDRLETLLGAVD